MPVNNTKTAFTKYLFFFTALFYINTVSAETQNNTNYLTFEATQFYHPVIGKHGAVATQEANATKVGIDVLKQGGNAVDAAVAIGYALAVTLPRAGNIGGGGFMNIWLNKEQKAYIINYRETAPSYITQNDIININKLSKNDFIYTYKSSGVPGTVAGLNLAAAKFGKLGKSNKFNQLIHPAIQLAENGFKFDESQLEGIEFAKDQLLLDKEVKRIFFKNQDATSYKFDDNFKQTDLAQTLKLIAQNGNAGFYSGKTADLIVKATNGLISKQDLGKYQAKIVEPIISDYKNYKIISPPPPSSGGVILAELLNIIANINLINNNSAQYYHDLTESMNIAYGDRNYNLGDPEFVKLDLNKLLSKNYAKQLADKINHKKHTPPSDLNKNSWPEGTNTTHYVVIDKDLNIVSNTYTLNMAFGNCKIIPGAGFFMNNELDDFTLALDKPNVYGLIQGEKNIIAAGKQPLSSMTPIIVLDNKNQPVFATGSPGGSRIITTVLQVILNVIDFKNNIAAAVAKSRIHSQLLPDILYYEDGISSDSIEILNNMGHKTEKTAPMGSAQSVYYDKKTGYFFGTADPRRAGSLAMAY